MQKITKNDIAEALNYKAWQRFFRKRTDIRKRALSYLPYAARAEGLFINQNEACQLLQADRPHFLLELWYCD